MITFTKSGSHITSGREAEFRAAFAALDWTPLTPGMKMSFSAGELVREALACLPGGRPTHVAESNQIAPLGLVAIRRDGFKGGPVNIYLADAGARAIVLGTEQLAAPCSVPRAA